MTTTDQKAKTRRKEAPTGDFMERQTISSKTVMQAIGNWLFGRCRVYMLSQPDRILRQKKIHWDRGTCNLEDEDGRVYRDVSWDDIEFVDDIEFHLADDE